jgi:hypothetical protein
MENEGKTPLNRLKKSLYQYLRHTYEGRASVALLFQKCRGIEEKITLIDSPDLKDHKVLEEIFEFIDQLHDESTRAYVSKHKETILPYIQKLS